MSLSKQSVISRHIKTQWNSFTNQRIEVKAAQILFVYKVMTPLLLLWQIGTGIEQ